MSSVLAEISEETGKNFHGELGERYFIEYAQKLQNGNLAVGYPMKTKTFGVNV